MPGPVLYSTNPYLKLHIQRKYRGDKHYVWCSDVFDSTRQQHYSGSGNKPPSSDPCALYGRLREDVGRGDLHSPLVKSQRNSLLKLATRWHNAGEVTDEQKAEIAYLAQKGGIEYFRPLIYVIPRAIVQARLNLVPPSKRANPLGEEWTLDETLLGTEFDVIEVG